MPVYFFNKNPNILFPGGSSYSKDEVDGQFSGLTSDGVTQSAMTYAIEDFISVTEINQIMSDLTVNYISQTEINNKFDTATADFWTSDEIDSVLSGNTSEFYNSEELDVFASGKTAIYSTSEEIYDNAYADVEVSQTYWHPEPFYKRTLGTDDTTYTLGWNVGSTTQIYVSGNTYWEVIEEDAPFGGASWYSLSVTNGESSLYITVTAEETNTGPSRTINLEFNANEINQVPFTVALTQINNAS